ncbi:hypothetical protein [Zooshikella harenae]|uniref:Uncharacterized protein n=1 Tax=Zooshikella harenae TaxID=2827238 RepID=A0ABS5ZFX2_9GAMM|nr:hypothetical protein [Zooshikella harenae]MBU2712969.1 hypothetical protein [Zooshikella harenae]
MIYLHNDYRLLCCIFVFLALNSFVSSASAETEKVYRIQSLVMPRLTIPGDQATLKRDLFVEIKLGKKKNRE